MAAISSTSYFSSQPQLPASGASPTTSGSSNSRQPRRHRTGSCVMLEAASGGGRVVGRTRSLTEEDLEELKGCLDLGFGFSYHEIPDLCGTLPGLELCYSMTRRFLDQQRTVVGQLEPTASPPPIPDWKISCPGDDPDQVKARLKYWAQTVACTVKLCRALRWAELKVAEAEESAYMALRHVVRTPRRRFLCVLSGQHNRSVLFKSFGEGDDL